MVRGKPGVPRCAPQNAIEALPFPGAPRTAVPCAGALGLLFSPGCCLCLVPAGLDSSTRFWDALAFGGSDFSMWSLGSRVSGKLPGGAGVLGRPSLSCRALPGWDEPGGRLRWARTRARPVVPAELGELHPHRDGAMGCAANRDDAQEGSVLPGPNLCPPREPWTSWADPHSGQVQLSLALVQLGERLLPRLLLLFSFSIPVIQYFLGMDLSLLQERVLHVWLVHEPKTRSSLGFGGLGFLQGLSDRRDFQGQAISLLCESEWLGEISFCDTFWIYFQSGMCSLT